MNPTVEGIEVEPRSDHIEVRGVSHNDLVEALELLHRVRLAQASQSDRQREDLLNGFLAAAVSLVPLPTVAQARRLAAHRARLLSSGVYDIDSLARVRGTSATRTSQWVTKRAQAKDIFTVEHDQKVLIPAFELTDSGKPRSDLRPLIQELASRELGGWEIWTWLTTPSSLLSGEIPEEVATTDHARAMRAAVRFARAKSE